jgi:hypothetical protein
MSAPIVLTRPEARALLEALDDADRLFMHHRGEELLELWRRIHLALCYIDGEQGYHGTEAERSLALTDRDALNLWLVLDVSYLAALPVATHARLAGLVARCRPSERFRSGAA